MVITTKSPAHKTCLFAKIQVGECFGRIGDVRTWLKTRFFSYDQEIRNSIVLGDKGGDFYRLLDEEVVIPKRSVLQLEYLPDGEG